MFILTHVEVYHWHIEVSARLLTPVKLTCRSCMALVIIALVIMAWVISMVLVISMVMGVYPDAYISLSLAY